MPELLALRVGCVTQFVACECKYSSIYQSFTKRHKCLDLPCVGGFVCARGRRLGNVGCFSLFRLSYVFPTYFPSFFFRFSILSFVFQGARILILAWENMCSAFGGPLGHSAFMLRFVKCS